MNIIDCIENSIVLASDTISVNQILQEDAALGHGYLLMPLFSVTVNFLSTDGT